MSPTEEKINKYLQYCIVTALRESQSNGEIKIYAFNELDNPMMPQFTYQFWYNEETNKCCIEYRYNSLFKQAYETDNIPYYLNGYIRGNFKYQTGVWPEILLVEDGYSERVDSAPLLTPYTIAFWKSLSGRYEFIEDETVTELYMNGLKLPTYPEEYTQKCREAYDTYFVDRDFDKFNTTLYNLSLEYKIDPDKRPDKDFMSFVEKVRELNDKYTQTKLTETQKTNYVNEYNELYLTYHSDTEVFNEKLKELNTKYGILTKLNDKVPAIFEEYKTLYNEFFGKELDDDITVYRYNAEMVG